MANGPALSTPKRGEIYIGYEVRDSLSLLDVVYANQFEGESFPPNLVEETEKNFYRGAPPKWLNFHIGEQANSDGSVSPVIKRDGYDKLVKQIQTKRSRPGTSAVQLLHQPGCGGTTLAMQVLWDLRKTFRSAVLTDPTSDVTAIANEVVHLFTAGNRGKNNTVLLLMSNEQILDNLQDCIMKQIAEQSIVTRMPVVIVLNCIRKNEVSQSDHVVLLEKVLSETESQKFNEKKDELSRRYGDTCKQFHGFNIMQSNFNPDVIEDACAVFGTIKSQNKPLKTQLAAFLCLLNAYVPGSYLLESQCLDFLKRRDSYEDLSLEDRMKPFSHLIITYQQDTRSEKLVRMAHPMIAQYCTDLMAEAGVTRSDTARNFLTCFCRDGAPPFVVGFIKDMLTKREKKENTEITDEKEKFSRLILDIQSEESQKQSASVLKVASDKFDENPFFPQALARFYYIEIKSYNLAEMWAKKAKERDPRNSFVADTLGQVYKNHLNNLEATATPAVLRLATKAIDAFKHEEQLARNEHGSDMREDGMTNVSNIFNIRGQFGYVQVCNIVYDKLVTQNETWKGVLTKEVSLGSALSSLGDNRLFRFNKLISSLQVKVVEKCAFLEKYHIYSKPDMKRDDPPYISADISECHRKYVQDSPSNQEGPVADIFAVALSRIDRENTKTKREEITTWWEEISSHLADSPATDGPALPRELPLRLNDAPEFHMVILLLCWPTDSNAESVFDLGQLIQGMQRSYERTYKTYYRSRYLHPLFFIGQGEGLNRFIHRGFFEQMHLGQNGETMLDWKNETLFQNPEFQQQLVRIEGVVKDFKVYASIGNNKIEVEANLRNSLWINRKVSFYLGFSIRGPVAFGIQTIPAENGALPGSDQQSTQQRGSPGSTRGKEN